MAILRNKDKEVFLVGTAHVSRQSALQVREVIQQARPDCVVVELCDERARKLRQKSCEGGAAASASLDLQMLKGFMPGGGIWEVLLKAIYKIFEGLGSSKPGGEFLAALEECDRLNIPVINGDQPASITLAKLKAAYSLTDLIGLMTRPMPPLSREQQELFSSNLSTDELVERLKTRSFVRSSTQMMRTVAPKLIEILLDERDEILCRAILNAKGKRVVAVVGMAHMEGIERRWDRLT